MKYSIVIPNCFMDKSGKVVSDGDEQLWFAEHCFERLKKYTELSYELILIDNGCVHGQDLLKKWADKLITNKKNLGFAPACNQGFDIAEREWIVCMNNDVFIYEGWLEALVRTFNDNKDCGVAMPALMKQTKDAREALAIEKIDLTQNYNSYGSNAEFGSCWMAKKELLDKVRQFNGGKVFDENFKIGFGEDRLLWNQVRWLGYQTYRTHKTRVFHQGNVTMGKIVERRKFTGPNRIYLHKLLEAHKKGTIYTEEEKKELRKRADIEWEEKKE